MTTLFTMTKRIALLAAIGGLGFSLAVLLPGEGFAGGKGKGAAHMSEKGAANTNNPASADPDQGLERALERMDEEGLEHSKAQEKLGAGDESENSGKAKGKGKGKPDSD